MLKKFVIFSVFAAAIAAAFFWSPDGFSLRAADVAHAKCIQRDGEVARALRTAGQGAQIVENELGDVYGDVKFFSRFDRENFHDDYFNDLSVSALPPGFRAYVMGHYDGLSRRRYNYVVCVFDPDGNIAGSPFGYRAEFVPKDGNWWYAIPFWADEVIDRPGVWRTEIILADASSGRRLVLSRNLPVAD